MRCPSCGKEIGEGKKFCTECGAPLGEPTTQMPQAAGPRTPTPPQPTTPLPAVAPVEQTPTAKQFGSKTWLILAVVLGALIMGGAVAGIVIWLVSSSGKPVAKVESPALTREDRKTLDLKKVPLDKNLSLDVAFKARYKEGGSGKLRVSVEDSTGEEIISHTWTVKSSDTLQKKSFVFNMTQSDGKPLKAIVELKVKTDGEELSDTDNLAYTVVKGQGTASKLIEICLANQATLRSAIQAFANAEGNYPDSMDMLVTKGFMSAMPECPSGGSYTYNVDYSVTPETLTVSCSVHGSL